MKITDMIIHEKRILATFSNNDIKKALTELVYKNLGYDIKEVNPNIQITFEDETEGSPPYKIGVRAIVNITLIIKEIE